VETSFKNTIADAGNRWLTYMQGFPPRVSGMTAQQVKDAKKAMAKAKGQAVTGIAASGTSTVAAATGVGAVGVVAIAAAAAVVSAIINKFGGSLQGCPTFPRPFLLRTSADPACRISDVTISQALDNFDAMWGRMEEGDGPPDDHIPIEDDPADKKISPVILAGGGIAVGAILFRLIKLGILL
jgi:hypothetical protein